MCHMMAPRVVSTAEMGRRILAAREEQHLRQQELAERAGLSRAYISRLERGLIPHPTITDLAKVAEAVEVSLIDLVMERPQVTLTRYSLDWEELQRRVEDLPPEIKAQVLRGYLESVAVLHEASGLARRN